MADSPLTSDHFKNALKKIKSFLEKSDKLRQESLETKFSQEQIQKYAEDLAKIYASEKERHVQLEQTNNQLKQYAKALTETYKQKINEEKLRYKLSRYFSPAIVDDMIINQKELALGGESRHVAIFFADIRKFTAISEKLNPFEIVEMLNHFFTLATDIIFECQGTVDKFIGDALMAVFGAPFPIENDSALAIQAAVKMQKAVTEHNHYRKLKNEPPVEIGIGINTGNVIAGNIGSEKRMDYTVIGDVVNVASRIQGLAKGGQILIGEETRKLATGDFHFEEFGVISLKNREKPEKIYQVNF